MKIVFFNNNNNIILLFFVFFQGWLDNFNAANGVHIGVSLNAHIFSDCIFYLLFLFMWQINVLHMLYLCYTCHDYFIFQKIS